MKEGNETVNTRQFEIGIVKAKLKKAAEKTKEVANKYENSQGKRDDLIKVVKAFEEQRKELVDCATLFLGFPLTGIEGAKGCVDVIETIDLLVSLIKLQIVMSGLDLM